MKAPSLLRSLVFWTGLLVMGFIVGAWLDSTRNSAKLTMGPCEIESWACGVVVKYRPGFAGSLEMSYGPHERPSSVTMMDPSHDCHAPKPPVTLALETFRFGRPGLQGLAEAKGHFMPGVTYGTRTIAGVREPVMDLALRDHYLAGRPVFAFSIAGAKTAGPAGWVAFLPHWLLLLLAAALVWGGLPGWRAWRWRRQDAAGYEEYRSRRYPWGRSPVLWGGLAVLCFSLWLWVDSTYQSSYVERDDLQLQSWASTVILMKHQGTTVSWDAGRRPHYDPNAVVMGEMRLARPGALGIPGWGKKPGPGPLGAGADEDLALQTLCKYLQRAEPARVGAGAWMLCLPHWMIVMAEFTVWWALLAWRARRWRRGQVPEAAAVEELMGPEEAVVS